MINYNTNIFGPYSNTLQNIDATGGISFSNYSLGIAVNSLGSVFDLFNNTLINNTQILANTDYIAYHVKMRLINVSGGTTNISFNTAFTNQASLAKYTTSPNQPLPWPDFIASSTDVEDHIPLKPIIDDVSSPSTTFKGGTGEIITINGRFFSDGGLIRFFNDADTKVGLMNLNFNDVLS